MLGKCSISELHPKSLVSHCPISLPPNFIPLFFVVVVALVINNLLYPISGVCDHMGMGTFTGVWAYQRIMTSSVDKVMLLIRHKSTEFQFLAEK